MASALLQICKCLMGGSNKLKHTLTNRFLANEIIYFKIKILMRPIADLLDISHQ